MKLVISKQLLLPVLILLVIVSNPFTYVWVIEFYGEEIDDLFWPPAPWAHEQEMVLFDIVPAGDEYEPCYSGTRLSLLSNPNRCFPAEWVGRMTP